MLVLSAYFSVGQIGKGRVLSSFEYSQIPSAERVHKINEGKNDFEDAVYFFYHQSEDNIRPIHISIGNTE